jgi:hypothetical protein
MSMRIGFSAFLVLLLSTAASAEDWTYEDLGVPIAYADNGHAQFQFACRGGDLAMGFWVRAPNRLVAAAVSMSVAITPDPAKGPDGSPTAATSFAQEIPLIHNDGTSVVIRGPVARQWARIARGAVTAIRVAYVRQQGALELFDSNDFGARGSSAAIKKVLDRCG